MKYRTKLYLAFVGMALGSTFLGLFIVYSGTKELIFKELQQKAIAIAATTAAFIDPEMLKKANELKSEQSREFLLIQEEMRRSRDANRQGKTFIKFVYTLMPDPQKPGQMIFGIDAEENTQDMIHFGDPDLQEPLSRIHEHLEEPYSPPHFITDQWGIWLSGFVPIRDAQGAYVATLGVDMRASDVLIEMHKLADLGLIALAAAFLAAIGFAFFLSRRAVLSLAYLCNIVKEIGAGNLKQKTHLETNDEFSELAEAINQMTKGLQERERLKVNFARYVSQHVLEKILKSETPMKLEGERKKVTLLFSDIRNFTALAEKLPPEDVVSLLNEYFNEMFDIIFKNQGTLDKIIGDGIMVEFGAPLEDPFQEKNAITTAIEMQKRLLSLCKKWEAEGKPTIKMGIGIHTGPAVVGNIGSERRMEYTAIGDTVNTAARLEKATKQFDVPIVVSETTFKAALGVDNYKNLGPIELKGKEQKITAYAIFP